MAACNLAPTQSGCVQQNCICSNLNLFMRQSFYKLSVRGQPGADIMWRGIVRVKEGSQLQPQPNPFFVTRKTHSTRLRETEKRDLSHKTFTIFSVFLSHSSNLSVFSFCFWGTPSPTNCDRNMWTVTEAEGRGREGRSSHE